MKNVKRIMAMMLAMVMVIGTMSMTASATGAGAAPTGSITVEPSTTVTLKNKTLKAYKILDATYSGTGADQAIAYTIPQKMLSFYDEYFKDSAGKTASQQAAAAGKTVDQFVAEKIGAFEAAEVKDFEYKALKAAKDAGLTAITGTAADPNVVFTDLEAGYYVIEDEGTAKPLSMLMLDTVTNAEVKIELKANDKTEKKIKTSEELVNEKANELGLGRTVNYEITQEIPDTTGFEYYYYVFNDTMSKGLTFDPESVVVKVGTTELKKGTDYYLYVQGDTTPAGVQDVLGNKTFVLAFEDVVKGVADKKYKAGDVVSITYNATVNSDAVVGVDPNNNTVTVDYSTDPSKDKRSDKIPGVPKYDQDHPIGNGPEKHTVTYTTKVTILKIDGKTEKPLPGVEFTLTGTSKDVVVNKEEIFEVAATGEYWLLKNGKYTKTAPQTAPTVRETTGPSGWVEAESTYTGDDTRVVGDKVYRPYKKSDGDKVHYVIVESNTGDYVSTTVKYQKVTITTTGGDTETDEYTVTRTGVTGSDGTLSFAQLGAGTFKLSETGILDGYNGIPDIDFTITCTTPDADEVIEGNEKAEWNITTTTPGVTFVKNNDGTFSIKLENNKGTELPSTGGIGTTLFYVVGSILVIGAAVLLISKRRMNAR